MSAVRARFLGTRARQAKDRRQKRATLGKQTILEEIGIGDAISSDYQNHLTCFWDFADRWARPQQKSRDNDVLCDRAVFACLDVESASKEEKLLVVLEKWAVENTSRSAITTPRFCATGGTSESITLHVGVGGFLMHFKGAALALYLVGLFATYWRSVDVLRMFAADVITPESSIPGFHHVLNVHVSCRRQCGFCINQHDRGHLATNLGGACRRRGKRKK